MDTEWISVVEAARRLGVHPNTVRAWCLKDKLEFKQYISRGKRLVSVKSVEQMIEDSNKQKRSESGPASK